MTITGSPPILIMHGDRDRLAPIADALSRCGANSTFVSVAGAGHDDHAFESASNIAIVATFLRAYLDRLICCSYLTTIQTYQLFSGGSCGGYRIYWNREHGRRNSSQLGQGGPSSQRVEPHFGRDQGA